MHYGVASYYRPGLSFPRKVLRESYPETGRDAGFRRARVIVAINSPVVDLPDPPCECVTGVDSRAVSLTGVDSRAVSLTGVDSRAVSIVGRNPQCEC